MSAWRITRGDLQFTVKDVAELKLMAVGGKIHSGDLVQPPGTTEWLYATEVQELNGLIRERVSDAAADLDKRIRRARTMRAVVVLLALGVFGSAAWAIWFLRDAIESSDAPPPLIGDHPDALEPLEAITVEYATLLSKPDARSEPVGEVQKDRIVKLIRKLGDYYEVELEGGQTGWVGWLQVIPAYLFSQELTDQYDPLFNPQRYLELANYVWSPRDEPGKPETLTDMMFTLVNPTDYGMADVLMHLDFFDGANAKVGQIDYAVGRLVPPRGDLYLEGIEIDMNWTEDSRCEAKILSARALLPAEFQKARVEEERRLKEEEAQKQGQPG